MTLKLNNKNRAFLKWCNQIDNEIKRRIKNESNESIEDIEKMFQDLIENNALMFMSSNGSKKYKAGKSGKTDHRFPVQIDQVKL